MEKAKSDEPQRSILVVVGFIGSGKSEVSSYIKSLGIPMFRTGDVIRKEVLKRGLTLNTKNSEMIARKYREEEGMDIAARVVGEEIKKLNPIKYPIICVEGPRDMFEIDYLAKLGNVIMVVVLAPIVLRFRRSRERKGTKLEPKTRDSSDFKEFKWRDESENERGQYEVTHSGKYARHEVENSGTKEELHEKIDNIISKIK